MAETDGMTPEQLLEYSAERCKIILQGTIRAAVQAEHERTREACLEIACRENGPEAIRIADAISAMPEQDPA